MDGPYGSMIARTLTCETVSLTLGQAELLARPEPLIILGEAGMGKTELTAWLARQDGVMRCTARQLLNRKDPRDLLAGGKLLVIDALDEAVARRDGDAVDAVLGALGMLGYPRFILTCRVADWRSATGRAAIAEQYPAEPLELRLQPFSLGDARAFLTARLGNSAAEALIAIYKGPGLSDLLGNPQTLTMIAEVAVREPPPTSIGALFERYADIAWFEHSDQHPDSVLEALGRDAVLDALGAGYAGLLLSGGTAITRAPRGKLVAGDMALGDAAQFPAAGTLGDALRSRLVASAGTERFTWPHRRVAEFLAARWLARQADTPRKQRRLLALFHGSGLVPASLRGLHAWLAWHGPDLARAAISADPMGVIEYGDADALSPAQAKALLAALQKLAIDDPWFLGRGEHAARGLVQPSMSERVRPLIVSPDTPVRLRLLLLEQLAGSPQAAAYDSELRAFLVDPAADFVIRRAAALALFGIAPIAEWPALIEALQREASEDSLRLALEIADELDYACLDDDHLADILVALALVRTNVMGLFWPTEHKLPDARLDSLLNRLSVAALRLGDPHDAEQDHELTAFAYGLMSRRVAMGGVVPERLWSWLDPFGDRWSYQREGQERLALQLANDDALRRGVQRHVLFGAQDEDSLYARALGLPDRSNGLLVTPQDVCVHLGSLGSALDADDSVIENWKDLVQLVKLDGEEGEAVRAAALRFAADRPDLVAWLEKLGEPRVFPWQAKQEARRREEEAARAERRAGDREQFGARIETMRGGGFAWLVSPAKAYLKLRSDSNRDLPAPERVIEWLGPEIAEAAFAGFEAFLRIGPPWPSAAQFAASHADGKGWESGPVIVAALAERQRGGRGFADLGDERLLAGLFALQHSPFESHAGIEGLRAALEAELGVRGLAEAAVRQWIEPQLAARAAHVSDLYSLLRSDERSALAVRLAAEWLDRYPDLPAGVELELVDCLIRADRHADLRRLARLRRGAVDPDDERRHSWDAVEAWLDFDQLAGRLDAAGGPEPELLWHLRARLGGGRWSGEEGTPVALMPRQLAWIVERFRGAWPSAFMPSSGAQGSHNPWDAADYLRNLIARLGGEIGDEAVALLVALRDAPEDGYSEYLRNVAAEQQRKRVEERYLPATLAEIAAALRDEAPRTASDLQAVLIEELAVLARRLAPGGDNANPIAGFYAGETPKGEEACRDHLLTLLRGRLPFGIGAEPEGEAADGHANDIACLLGPDLMVPVEVKGQWHKTLWHAADSQLDRLYASDWRAERRGIYLVLWFGNKGKPLKPPPRGIAAPATAEELRTALVARSPAAKAGRVAIVVLDLGGR